MLSPKKLHPFRLANSIIWLLRVLLSAVFLIAGLSKASNIPAFHLSLLPLTFLPDSFLILVAYTLPWLEILVACLLLVPRTSRIGSSLALLLCLCFITVLLCACALNIPIACSCFGQPEDLPPTLTSTLNIIYRDLALALMALLTLFSPQKSRPTNPRQTRTQPHLTPPKILSTQLPQTHRQARD